jgi:hypothetical protein
MKNRLLVILFLWAVPLNYAQLNCITHNHENGGKITTCFHKNGSTSTITTWDAAHREGTMQAFNAQGQEIFYYNLRNFAGHASVYINYYPNGQVKKAEYSSAPDGGIQFWRIIQTFDESGNQTAYTDLSQPDGHPVLLFPNDSTSQTYYPEKKQEAVVNPPPYQTIFELVNETHKTITVLLKANNTMVHDTLVILKPKQSFAVTCMATQQKFLEAAVYAPQTKVGKIKKEKYKFIMVQPAEATYTRTYTWHILKK